MEIGKLDLVIRLLGYLCLLVLVSAGTTVIADIYYGFPFPDGLLMGLTFSALIPIIHLAYLGIRYMLQKTPKRV